MSNPSTEPLRLSLAHTNPSKDPLVHPSPFLMGANPTASIVSHIIRHQYASLVRFVVATQRHTTTIPTPMAVQISRSRNDRTPVNSDHASRNGRLKVHADSAFRMAGDILAVVVHGVGTDGPALDHGTGTVGECLVELVDQVVVGVKALVVRFDAHIVAAAVDAESGRGGG